MGPCLRRGTNIRYNFTQMRIFDFRDFCPKAADFLLLLAECTASSVTFRAGSATGTGYRK